MLVPSEIITDDSHLKKLYLIITFLSVLSSRFRGEGNLRLLNQVHKSVRLDREG